MQEVVGVDDALHQDVRLTLANDAHGFASRLIGVCHVDSLYMAGILLQSPVPL